MIAPRGRWSNAFVLVAVVGVVTAGLVVDATVATGRSTGPADAALPLVAGSTTCAAGRIGEDSTLTATTVAAPAEAEAATAADQTEATAADQAEAGRVALVAAADGEVVQLATPSAASGVATTAVTGVTGEVAIGARWEDTPVLLSRRWTIGGTDRVPGTVEGPCPAAPASEWVVPGVATAGGAAAQLHLANPTEAAASLSVTFTTPDGPVEPTRLANLAVPAHASTTIDLNQFVPEEPDLGVVVRTRSGRVVAEVQQVLEAAVGGVDGRALVAAEPVARETWTIPWVRGGEGESAWVWVTNAGEEATDVRLVLHTEEGPVVPPDTGVTLAPGTTQRIDLRGALGEVGAAAVTVRSAPGVPIFASGGVLRVVPDDAVRGGVAVVAGHEATDGLHAAMSAVGATGQQRVLRLANPGEVDATAQVSVIGPAGTTSGVATDLAVPAGSVVPVALDEFLPAEGGFAVLVDVTEGRLVSAVVQEALEGPLDLSVLPALPFPRTIVVTERGVQRDRSLLHPIQVERLGSASDARVPDADGAQDGEVELDAEVAPAPEPTATVAPVAPAASPSEPQPSSSP